MGIVVLSLYLNTYFYLHSKLTFEIIFYVKDISFDTPISLSRQYRMIRFHISRLKSHVALKWGVIFFVFGIRVI